MNGRLGQDGSALRYWLVRGGVVALVMGLIVFGLVAVFDEEETGRAGGPLPEDAGAASDTPDVPTPEDVALNTTQAFFDRDFDYLASYASASLVEDLQGDGYGGETADMLAAAFEEEQEYGRTPRPPPEGEVYLSGEISYENWANQPWTTYRFDYTLSTGGDGDAGVILELTDSAEDPYRIVAIGITHPGSTPEGGTTALFGPYASMEFQRS